MVRGRRILAAFRQRFLQRAESDLSHLGRPRGLDDDFLAEPWFHAQGAKDVAVVVGPKSHKRQFEGCDWPLCTNTRFGQSERPVFNLSGYLIFDRQEPTAQLRSPRAIRTLLAVRGLVLSIMMDRNHEPGYGLLDPPHSSDGCCRLCVRVALPQAKTRSHGIDEDDTQAHTKRSLHLLVDCNKVRA